jgi:hypothetical protein
MRFVRALAISSAAYERHMGPQLLVSGLLLGQVLCLAAAKVTQLPSVGIYHLIDNKSWGEIDGSAVQGDFKCSGLIKCEVFSSDCASQLPQCLYEKFQRSAVEHDVLVSMYHIHTWGTLSTWPHAPSSCVIPAHYTVAESEESHGRFHKLFGSSFAYYDANSTTSPYSTIPRTYFTGLNASTFLPMKPFSQLIQGAVFVASTCHRGEGTTKRVSVVTQMQSHFRVDSLGRCHTSRNLPEGVTLGHSFNAQEHLRMKQRAINNYLFYCAFENTYERGYVTEKVFDALIAGVVPIYLGPSEDCRPLLPHPNAAIFLDDYNHNIPRLVEYLKYLSNNETAYEQHRAWRKSFNPALASTLFTKSWPCRVCEWAAQRAHSDVNFPARDDRMKRYAVLKRNGTCL